MCVCVSIHLPTYLYLYISISLYMGNTSSWATAPRTITCASPAGIHRLYDMIYKSKFSMLHGSLSYVFLTTSDRSGEP